MIEPQPRWHKIQDKTGLILLGNPTWKQASGSLLLEHSQMVTLGRTRGVSDWVLRATISNSCCCKALTTGSPEEGSWLSQVAVLEVVALLCMSLRMGKTNASVTRKYRKSSIYHMQTQGQQGSLMQVTGKPLPPCMSSSKSKIACTMPPSGRRAIILHTFSTELQFYSITQDGVLQKRWGPCLASGVNPGHPTPIVGTPITPASPGTGV